MKFIAFSLVSIMSVGLHASVDLTLNEPKKFMDIREHDMSVDRSAEAFQNSIKEYLEQHKLLKDRNLTITFNNVDRAGEVRYGMAQNRGMRVLRDVATVRLQFSYDLKDSSGNTIAQGDENLKELFSLSRVDYRRSDREKYYFEKKLLDDWLENLLNK
ncbi:MAG: DUF3016 domain-containing protein [Gammaproteobacteria bacterium]|nr:DUF3016 domain-containing protein [Gammaproteobacteria bacterium]